LSIAAFFTKIPHIALDDTECNLLTWLFYVPFASVILTPFSFPIKVINKQIRFAGNFELTYLHPKRFSPDTSVVKRLGLRVGEPYIIVRFVSHFALHDFFMKGISNNEKTIIVKMLSLLGKVFISSEIPLNKELKLFQSPLSPSKMHNAIAFSSLVYGESATMASEAATLGVPSIFIDKKGRCYTKEEEEKYDLVCRFNPTDEGIRNSLKISTELITTPGIKDIWQSRRS
jgi:uncharacterized protein